MTVTTRALLATAALLLASAACVHGALTATQIVDALKGLADRSDVLQTTTVFITFQNGLLFKDGLGPYPQIIAGLNDIASAAKAFTDQLSNPPNVPSTFDVDATVAAFSSFAQEHIELMHRLSAVAMLWPKAPTIGLPTVNVLNKVDTAVNVVAFGVGANLSGAAQTQVLNYYYATRDAIAMARDSFVYLTNGGR